MISEEKDTRARLAELLSRAGERKSRELTEALKMARKQESPEVIRAVQWILASSPLSDLANYSFDLFLSCARHGVRLRRASPFCREVPEDIYRNYVLHPRVNEEELCDCRRTFWQELEPRVRQLGTREAILEANYWCAEHVMYQSTDDRTISALGAYHSGYGRCGEESVFAVNVLRSVGIPARQVYTPRWSHCDDNHAWVEVYCEGSWYFLGACEPEEVLNKGWFTNASSRAMLVHSRCFGPIAGEKVISRVGMATFLNHLDRYAVTRELTVRVADESGAPVAGAQVSFGILNYSHMYPVAEMTTGENGQVTLTCGCGSLHIHVKKGNIHCEKLVFTPETDRVELVLRQEQPVFDTWQDFAFLAPRDRIVGGVQPTEEQKALRMQKAAAAGQKREARVAAMFDEEAAAALVERFGCSSAVYGLLKESRGNAGRLMDFLADQRYQPRAKEALLLTLSRKDRRDVDPDILRECLETCEDCSGVPAELLYPCVLCPRVMDEPLTRNRRFLLEYFTQAQKRAFRQEPRRVWDWIGENIGFDPSLEYGQIVTCPVGALTVRNASLPSRRILFVSVCRALGIPARVDPVEKQVQYWKDGSFVTAEPVCPGSCQLVLQKEPGESWQYGPDFGLSVLTEGDDRPLDLGHEAWEEDQLRLTLEPGQYRILTDNRLPNGDIHGSRFDLQLKAGETRTVRLRKQGAELKEMLDKFALDEFTVQDEAGDPVTGSELTRHTAVLMWLDEGMEPTEHILNEMLEQQAAFRELPGKIVFLFRSRAALENAKVRRALEAFPEIRVCYDSFVPNVETLARRLYCDPDKLPLILVTTGELNAVYGCSGYNVGTGDMILRICSSV